MILSMIQTKMNQTIMLNYNTSTKAALHGTAREAVTRKLPKFEITFLALPYGSRLEAKYSS